MLTFVALMRGINVGSAHRLPMADLRDLCLSLGWTRPETCLQSGNLIINAAGGADGVCARLERALAARFGFAVDVVVREAAAWQRCAAANPFAGDAAARPSMLHLYVSRDRMNPRAARVLESPARTGERIRVAGGGLWIDYGARGVHSSALRPPLIDRACGSPTTGRNWNTVKRIAAMIDARRGP